MMEKALEKIIEAKENINMGYNEWAISCLDEAIAELEEAMKPKTCDGCKFLNGVICKHDRGLYCVRQFEEDYFQPKDNA